MLFTAKLSNSDGTWELEVEGSYSIQMGGGGSVSWSGSLKAKEERSVIPPGSYKLTLPDGPSGQVTVGVVGRSPAGPLTATFKGQGRPPHYPPRKQLM
jgi:hypothetical protein